MSTFKALIAGALILSSVTASAAPLSCSLAFNPDARRWYAADSVDLLKQIAKDGNIDVQDDMAFVTKTLMLKLGLQMRPEVLRVSGDFEGVVRTFDDALAREAVHQRLSILEQRILPAEQSRLERGRGDVADRQQLRGSRAVQLRFHERAPFPVHVQRRGGLRLHG